MATDIELAWCAGIVDGEGCITISKSDPVIRRQEKSPKYRLWLVVSMTHRATIDRLKEVLGAGSVFESDRKKYNTNQKTIYRLTLCSHDAARAIELLLPYLVTKRSEALIALEFDAIPKTLDCRVGITDDTLSMYQSLMDRIRANKPKTGRKKHIP